MGSFANRIFEEITYYMKKLVFATSNPNKVREVNHQLEGLYEIASLKDIGCHEDIPETQPTIQGNAIQKAEYVVKHYALDCFSEDTGLEVFALNGEPGIYSARYAGPQRNMDDNMNLLLQKLADKADRSAQFRTVIALYQKGQMHTFEGIVKGTIQLERSGTDGFGYDPIFLPDGHDRTFAEMTKDEKTEISHRGRAVRKLIAFLQNQNAM